MNRYQQLSVAIGLTAAITFVVQAEPNKSLKGVPIPQPSAAELSKYVINRPLALAIGKALFWDMQVGSDGVQSCASCHFKAGADNRSFNQVSPSPASLKDPNFSLVVGANAQLTRADFPLSLSVNDVVSSQGICRAQFRGIVPGSAVDASSPLPDEVFQVGGRNVRRVEPRNTPTTIAAVFNHRNFWDGRAKNIFNGVSPFGDQDPAARVAQLVNGSLQSVRISIPDSSLASQAVGPLTSELEMSFVGRSIADVGKKMVSLKPLAKQRISSTDSVLGIYANLSGHGWNTQQTYGDLIKLAFSPQWWSGSQIVVVNPDRSLSFRATRTGAANEYTQMEYNFSLFFGLAVQLYEASLVPDDTPFDRYDSRIGQLTGFQLAGKAVFEGKGKCVNCHGGAEFTNASVTVAKNQPITRMTVGNGLPAVYDEGYYNIAVRPTVEDIGVGGTDPWGNPLSFSRLFQRQSPLPFVPGEEPGLAGFLRASERVAVDGAHKTSTVRNVALTAPYFWNGGKLTLRQVIDFYNAGGDFRRQNIDNLDADIQPLGLSEYEKEALLAYMNALTDARVQFHRAPFDHPSLQLPLGGAGCNIGTPTSAETMLAIPEVGRNGFTTLPPVLDNFLGVNQNDANPDKFPQDREINLAGQYNVNAIVSAGTRPLNGGIDGAGNALSSGHLGTRLSYGGLTFNLGPVNTANGVSNKTITVKEGVYNNLKLLVVGLNGTQMNQGFRLNYSDGTSTTVTRNISDWSSANPWLWLPNYNTRVISPLFRITATGATQGNSFLLLNYGWTVHGVDIPVDHSKVLTSITLPANRSVVILGMHVNPVGTSLLSKP